MSFPRYAIYFVPPAESPLYRFGAGVIGYDAFSARPIPFPGSLAAKASNWKDLTNDPRKYGFHATLKAPFSLAPGYVEKHLVAAATSFAEIPRAIPVIVPAVRTLGSFIAVVTDTPSPMLQALAKDCVIAFEPFRAPLTAEDRLRRNASSLTDRQIVNLERWGYPYVFDEFRFHMTLTGAIQDERREPILNILHSEFSSLDLHTVAIDHVALLRQDNATSSFAVLEHLPLIDAIKP